MQPSYNNNLSHPRCGLDMWYYHIGRKPEKRRGQAQSTRNTGTLALRSYRMCLWVDGKPDVQGCSKICTWEGLFRWGKELHIWWWNVVSRLVVGHPGQSCVFGISREGLTSVNIRENYPLVQLLHQSSSPLTKRSFHTSEEIKAPGQYTCQLGTSQRACTDRWRHTPRSWLDICLLQS